MTQAYFAAPTEWPDIFYKTTGAAPVQAADALTTSYQYTSDVALGNHRTLGIYCQWLLGTETTMEMQVECSFDQTNWFVAHVIEAASTGVSALSPHTVQATAGNYTTTAMIYFAADVRGAPYARVGYKATGTVTGTATIWLTAGA